MECVSDSALNRACRIIFGPEVPASDHFLHCLSVSRVTKAFREKAFLTHPDRFVSADEKTRERNTRLFIEAKWAYDHLRDFCRKKDRWKHSFSDDEKTARKQERKRSGSDRTFRGNREARVFGKTRYYTGLFPRRKLLFGEFLYYSRAVPWDMFIKAIVLQRQGRPRFGDIAERWRYLDQDEIMTIVSGRRFPELFGQAAVRMKKMSALQAGAVLYYQRIVQKPIGEFFVESGHIERPFMESYLKSFYHYNQQFPFRRNIF